MIRSVVTTVRNFVAGWVSPTPPPSTQETEQQQLPGGEPQSALSRFNCRFFSNASRKRPASNAFEPELTDDEDDFAGPSVNTAYLFKFPVLKRPREDYEFNMASWAPKPSHGYTTRGSGVAPRIEGVAKQPWEFNFNFRNRRTPKTPTAPQVPLGLPSGCSGSTGRGTSSYSNSSKETTSNCKWNNEVSGGSRSNSNPNPANKIEISSMHRCENVRDNSQPTTSKKNPEVITLDDNSLETPAVSQAAKADPPRIVPPGKHEIAYTTPKLAMQLKGKNSNKLSQYMDGWSQKLWKSSNSAIRQETEKQRYQKLLADFEITSANSYCHNLEMYGRKKLIPLSRSKLPLHETKVMYKKFDDHNFERTIHFDKPSLANRREAETRGFSNLVPLLPRLYSSPNEPESSNKTRALISSQMPPIIDLDTEPKPLDVSHALSPIFPVTIKETHAASPKVYGSLCGNFTNLEDALNKSIRPEEIPSVNDDDVSGELLVVGPSQLPGDEDLSIIAERIVNTSRNRTLNTLALEQTSCPYVEKEWLNDKMSTYKENRKHREDRIREEMGTLDILRKESTLEKDLEERIRKKLTLTEIIVLEEQPKQLPEMTEDMRRIIEHAKLRGNDNEVLAQVKLVKDTISITRGDVKTLGPSQWLNDNVINTYMGLIVLRSKGDKYPNVYSFQTFFYPKLLKEGYSNSLKRWTRKDDIFAHDLLIFPIHLGLHWCLACVDFRKKSIRYFDSLGGDNNKCLNSLLEYICKEMKERKQKDLDKSEWTLENVKGIPHQQNGSDCGMFACKFAEYLSRDSDFTFTQENMPYYRDRMIYELIREDLLDP